MKLKITTKWTLKMLELGMVSSFRPHSMCKRVERVTAKLDAPRVQTGQSLSEYQGFGRELIYYTGTSMFLYLFELPTCFVFSMQHSKRFYTHSMFLYSYWQFRLYTQRSLMIKVFLMYKIILTIQTVKKYKIMI